MAWFKSTLVNSGDRPESADNSPGRFSTAYNRLRGLTEGSIPTTTYDWPFDSTASPKELSSNSHHTLQGPPRLENLTCSNVSGPRKGLQPISFVTLQEQRCVLSWFQGWNVSQRELFMQDLLGKAVPGKVCMLLDSLSTLQVKDKLPSIFECQLRLWTQWFESWEEEERNNFLSIIEENDPGFVAQFYSCVAGTAGKD